jgi:hypothetical protein
VALGVVMFRGVSVAAAFAAAVCASSVASARDFPGASWLHPTMGMLPAVSGANGKLAVGGGSLYGRGFGFAQGAITTPIGEGFGFQLDAVLGRKAVRSYSVSGLQPWSESATTFGGVGGHLFSRDPETALLGLYASYFTDKRIATVQTSRLGAEGEFYFDRLSLEVLTGAEFGRVSDPGRTVRIFDMINLAFYGTDDLRFSVGHRYLGGRHALALGTEWQTLRTSFGGVALFAEGRVGSGTNRAVWGGLRGYFGQPAKSLIRRHREDDPQSWSGDDVFNGQACTSASCSGPAVVPGGNT